jgi:hypothetical protein
MPLYMVIPSFDGDVTTAALQIQGKHKVRYRGYWVEVGGGKVLCLVEAPSAAAPEAVHCQAVHCEGGPSL